MKRIRIKICGIKTLSVAEFCVDNGIDCLGFNFSPMSKRKIDLSDSIQIINELHKRYSKIQTQFVALFFKTPQDEMTKIYKSGVFQTIQYLPLLEDLSFPDFSGEILPQIGVSAPISDNDLNRSDDWVILDSFHKEEGGGTGSTFPWKFVESIKRNYFLAGGLNPENVKLAVDYLNPPGLDVASGVEETPGEKSIPLIQRFIKNARP